VAFPTEYLRQLRRRTGAPHVPLRMRAPSGELVDLEAAREHPRVVVTGPRGSGKSAFLRYVAFQLCCGMENTHTETLLLPVLLSAPELAAHAGLVEFLAARDAEQAWGLGGGYLGSRLSDGSVMVLADDVDAAAAPLQVTGTDPAGIVGTSFEKSIQPLPEWT
jgi:hypothetical protein